MIDSVLRPMSISQVLDRTFSLYRNNFQLFAGIAGLPGLLGLTLQLALMPFNFMPALSQDRMPAPSALSALFLFAGIFIVCLLPIYLLGYALTFGATIYAVSHSHLGTTTTTIGESYRKTLHSLGRMIGIVVSVFSLSCGALVLTGVVIVGLAVIIPMAMRNGVGTAIAIVLWMLGAGLVAGGVVFSFRLTLRLSLAVPVCLVEKRPVIDSLKRSWFLAQGSVSRIVWIYFLTGILGAALSWAIEIPSNILGASHAILFSNIWSIAASFIATTLASPVATIAIALVYYDQRVRKEAFDLQLMMEAIEQPAPGRAAAAFPGIG